MGVVIEANLRPQNKEKNALPGKGALLKRK
jgi:hypothetical protein